MRIHSIALFVAFFGSAQAVPAALTDPLLRATTAASGKVEVQGLSAWFSSFGEKAKQVVDTDPSLPLTSLRLQVQEADSAAAFKAFGWKDAGEGLFSHPGFMYWARYTKQTDGENSHQRTLEVLTQYIPDNDARFKTLFAGMKVKGVEKFATDLLKRELDGWVDLKKVDKVFNLLQLESRPRDLKNPAEQVWMKYVSKIYDKYNTPHGQSDAERHLQGVPTRI